jgi:hypothetical protein
MAPFSASATTEGLRGRGALESGDERVWGTLRNSSATCPNTFIIDGVRLTVMTGKLVAQGAACQTATRNPQIPTRREMLVTARDRPLGTLLTGVYVRPLGQELTWTQRPRTPVENRWSMTIFG